MASIHDSVETVNAAAAAIVVADSRVQPAPTQKRRWGGWWSQYWCFGSQKKDGKRIGHAALVPEPIIAHGGAVPAAAGNTSHSMTIVLPFIAPPSSPASFLQSDPPTGTHTPARILNLTSHSSDSDSQVGPANVFAIGPYANETQLVSPPVFSAFTTEPSTAAVTPPPEPVQFTSPSSPEVPFAQLLTSSLNRTRRNSGGSRQKNGLSYYDFHQLYSGSPTGYLISPGSVNSASGTSSPYPPIKQPILELRIADASKLFDSEKFATRKWGSRLDSGSLTPDGVGPASRDSLPLENLISELASLANSETGSQTEETLADRRVSFKFAGEDIPTSVQRKALPSLESVLSSWKGIPSQLSATGGRSGTSKRAGSCGELYAGDALDQTQQTTTEEAALDWKHKHSSISFGSVKEFNFDGSEVEVQDPDGEVREIIEAQSNWTFFPLLQTGVR